LAGQSFTNHVAPEALLKEERPLLERLKTEEATSLSLLLLTEAGDRVRVAVQFQPLRVDADSPIKYQAVMIALEEAPELPQDTGHLNQMLQDFPEPALITNAEGHITWINSAFEERLGYTAAEALGQKPGHLLQGEQTEAELNNRIREALAAQRPVREHVVNYKRDASVYEAEMFIWPLYDPDREEKQYLSISFLVE
jgi:methyl-accepting chemotaxis protein